MSTTNILDLNNRIDELEKNSGGGGSADSAKRSDIATEFSTETNYTAGNFVYYEGKLYQFNADHSAGAWDSTDVVEANVTDQVVSNASAIAGLTASDVAYDNTDSGLTATDVQDAVDELAANKQNILSVYGTNSTYSGTTSTETTILSLQLPAGEYMVLPAGYVDGYGAYIYKGTTGTGWAVNGTNTITLTETTTLNIGPAASASTTWSNFALRFLKIA